MICWWIEVFSPWACRCTVSSLRFKPQNFKVRGSSPRIIAHVDLSMPLKCSKSRGARSILPEHALGKLTFGKGARRRRRGYIEILLGSTGCMQRYTRALMGHAGIRGGKKRGYARSRWDKKAFGRFSQRQPCLKATHIMCGGGSIGPSVLAASRGNFLCGCPRVVAVFGFTVTSLEHVLKTPG